MPVSEAVSDTGPLISFEKLPYGFRLLQQLFDRLYIPEQVLRELQAGHPGRRYLQDHGLIGWVEVVPPGDFWGEAFVELLDAGERAAIGLAIAKSCPLLIEERLGRKLAQEAGVTIIGAAGLIYQAFQREILTPTEAAEALGKLHAAGRIGKLLLEELVARIIPK